MHIVYLTSDLMFSSRVCSCAASMGMRVDVVNSRATLLDCLSSQAVAVVMIDLEHREANAGEIMADLSARKNRPTVVAYAPHVKERLLAEAQAAECDIVLSRGQFDKQFRTLLPTFAAE